MLKSKLVFFFCCVLISAMVLSPFLLSLSMIALVVLSLICFDNRKFWIDKEAFKRSIQLINHPDFVVISLSFFIVLFSFWQTFDWEYWWVRMRIKAPFLILPFVFFVLPPFSKRTLLGLHYFLLLLLAMLNIVILYHFFNNADQVIELMKQGKPMWTPRNHIRYSLLLAWSIIGGIYLVNNQFYWKFSWERLLIGTLTLYNFGVIHFLSVKSGILILYVGLFTWSLHYVFSQKKWMIGLILLGGLLILPITAHQLFPTLQRKVAYTIHDFKMYAEGKGGDYSDAGRIASIQAGIAVGKKAPIWGVGAGNLRHEIHQYFDSHFPQYYEKLMPQNQFLFVWAGTGIWGIILFGIAFFLPFFYKRHYQNELLLIFYSMQLVTILIEQTYENAVGIAHYLFFLLLMLQNLMHEDKV